MESTAIYTEMGQTTEAQIEYVVSAARAGQYRIVTDLELKGRGITKTGNGENHKRNKKTYRVTENALNGLKKKYTCCFMASL